jgi:hypothetical protein
LAGKNPPSCSFSFSTAAIDCVTELILGCRAIEQALLDMQDICQPKKRPMARKNSEQALDLLAH